MNFGEFLKKSGTLSNAQDVYWSVQLEQLRVYFGSGDFSFYDQSMDLQNKRQSDLESVMHVFKDKFIKNMGFSFELFGNFQTDIDIVVLYKDTSQIPIKAIFLNVNYQQVVFNFKIQKMELILDIVAYFNNLLLVRQFLALKPRVPFMRQKRLIYYTQKFRIENPSDLKLL